MNACSALRLRCFGRVLLPLLLLGWAAAPAAYAQETEVAQLRQQVEQLRAQLARLDARLHELEAVPAAVPGAPAVPAPAQATLPQGTADRSTAPAPGATAPAAAPAGDFSPAEREALRDQAQTATALQRWSELRAGMSQDEVRSRLGAPQSVIPVDNRTGWVYRYARAGTGSVFFDHSGRVISLMAPGQGALHLY